MEPFLEISDILLDGLKIKVVRDDLYPSIGGGVKARKADEYERYFLNHGFNACVTTGGIQSNHNRAIAIMCAKHGWRCHIVFHGTRERFMSEKGNALLVRNTHATVEFVEADKISYAMDSAMERLTKEGYRPMYVHGGGHDIPGGKALVDAVHHLKTILDTDDYKPDYIFHASGTGSTQAGIAVGLDAVGWDDINHIGISVARQNPRGRDVIIEFANKLSDYYGSKIHYDNRIVFNTDYLNGGYERTSSGMISFLGYVMKETGIMFDKTYSGKAFYGMCDYIKRNHLQGNFLFWHTGGLMNLMA